MAAEWAGPPTAAFSFPRSFPQSQRLVLVQLASELSVFPARTANALCEVSDATSQCSARHRIEHHKMEETRPMLF